MSQVPYEKALRDTLEFISKQGSDFIIALRYGAYSALSIIYRKSIENVYDDAIKLNEELLLAQKRARKEIQQKENEDRRLENLRRNTKC
jgi:hypothetical protein